MVQICGTAGQLWSWNAGITSLYVLMCMCVHVLLFQTRLPQQRKKVEQRA